MEAEKRESDRKEKAVHKWKLTCSTGRQPLIIWCRCRSRSHSLLDRRRRGHGEGRRLCKQDCEGEDIEPSWPQVISFLT